MQFEFLISNLAGLADPSLPIAASRCGATGLLNLEHLRDLHQVRTAIGRLNQYGRGRIGFKVSAHQKDTLDVLPDSYDLLLLAGGHPAELAAAVDKNRAKAHRIFVEITSLQQAQYASKLSIDGLIAKGNEAAGWVGEETTFILLQRLTGAVKLPVWAYGGIGIHSVAACYAAGAQGVLLDSQAALMRESEMSPRLRALLEQFRGDETMLFGTDSSASTGLFRAIKPASSAKTELFPGAESDSAEAVDRWRAKVEEGIGWTDASRMLRPLGQDVAQAKPLAERFQTVSRLVHGLKQSLNAHIKAARSAPPLRAGEGVAQSHGTKFPIVQGPMTRVSDVAAFAKAVAAGGALPFLALALLRKKQVQDLLEETKRQLGNRPWGVGILGFVPLSLRNEQFEVIRQVRPRFVLIAGGRPDQVATFEQEGIETYFHVPSPHLLELFVEAGARRFVFEGRECGGHVGPRSSFVLWDAAIETVLGLVERGVPPEELHVVFAGGIHDPRSATMVSAMAAPLAEKGVKVGVLMGTAYLFTKEAVECGAVVPGFQETALACHDTVLLESKLGHATRCADTAFAKIYRETKTRLIEQGRPGEDIHQALEDLILGRLRIASKGVTRGDTAKGEAKYVNVDEATQRCDGMYMIGQLAALRAETTTIKALHKSLCADSEKLLEKLEEPFPELAVAKGEREQPFDVAIVGIGCLLPKAQSAPAFWRNLIEKVDAIREIPGERFDAIRYFDENRSARDKIYSKWGGFLEPIEFDPMKYGVPPNSLSSIDPFQLLCLEVTRQALADAACLDQDFPREKTGVIFGAGGGLGDLGMQYGFRAELPRFLKGADADVLELLPEWTEDSFAGILLNVGAGRVANRFDLGGVNFTVDAACASSLAAVYLAARELSNGSADLMIAGGVDTVQSPFGYLCFSKTRALSPSGRCKTFDESADGTSISEGLAVVVLKRLADAERDGDRIYAVIKSVAGSSDGRGKSLTAPRAGGQRRALERAYARAGVSPASVGLVEAHGTGTVAGDTAELEALTALYKDAGAAPRSCALGSVKSAIGHTKAAAGVAGLIKAALALHHKVIPPTLHVSKPIAGLQDEASPYFAATEPMPWLQRPGGEPRRAGVSAFGFGGTNFHAVLEEHVGDFTNPLDRTGREVWDSELFLWRAGSARELGAQLSSWREKLGNSPPANLGALAESTWRKLKDAGDLRLSIVAAGVQDLIDKLDLVLGQLDKGVDRIEDPEGVYLYSGRKHEGKLAFLCPGQGSQYPYMCRDLILNFAEPRLALEKADRQLSTTFAKPLSSFVLPPPTLAADESERQMKALTDTAVAQPALGTLEIGLIRLLERLGLRPDLVAGHSYGEYVALHCAGVLSEEDLLGISQRRGEIVRDSVMQSPGGMLAVLADVNTTSAAIDGLDQIWLANLNSPGQTILAGSSTGVEAAMQRLTAKGLSCRNVPVACAFHSPLMKQAAEKLANEIHSLQLEVPRIDVFSNTLGAAYPDDPAQVKGILARHLTEPVQFVREIESMHDAGARWFVEVGPKRVLGALATTILEDRECTVLSLDDPSQPALSHFLGVVGQLWSGGIELDLDRLYRGRIKHALVNDLAPEPAAHDRPKWLVDGGRVWPGNQPRPHVEPVRLPGTHHAARPQASVIAQGVRTAEESAPYSAEPSRDDRAAGTISMNRPEVPAMPQPLDTEQDVDTIMLEYQKMMNRFLETEREIVLQYLSGGGLSPSARSPHVATEAPSVRTADADSAQAAAPSPPAGTGLPAEVSHPEHPAEHVSVVRPAADLLRLISERTGYPGDMLDPDLNLEADLGIDSIKRVEILSAFQQSRPQPEQASIAKIMEALTASKTLREITDLLQSITGQTQAPQGRPDADATETADQCLVRLFSERTGYPEDMLQATLAIEGDLGIDSIKRVEILSAFQQSRPESEKGRIQQLMESLTAAKTIGEMLDTLGQLRGHDSAGAAHEQTRNPAERQSDDVPPEQANDALLDIVSERTGYPTDMLDPDLNLEADLGIDSIKRVEILGAFQKSRAPEEQHRIQGLMDELTVAKTLREMMSLLEDDAKQRDDEDPAGIRAGVGLEGPRPVAREMAVASDESPRFVFEAVEAPLHNHAQADLSGEVWLISDDGKGVGASLQERIRKAGASAILLKHGDHVVAEGNDAYTADLTDAASVKDVLSGIRGRYGAISGILHLLPLGTDTQFEQLDLAAWRHQIALEVKSLYHLTRENLNDFQGGSAQAKVVSVTKCGNLGLLASGHSEFASQGGVIGFMRTLQVERPEIACKLVDFAPGHADVDAFVWQELTARDEYFQLLYEEGRRLSVVPVASSLREREGTALQSERPNPDWVFLLTGGARGITAEIAVHLAKAYHPTLILIGRTSEPPTAESPLTLGVTDPHVLKSVLASSIAVDDPRAKVVAVEEAYRRLMREREIRTTLKLAAGHGAKVEYHQVDVRNEDGFGRFIDQIYQRHGRLDAVIHGAGVIEDKLLQDKVPESFDRVLHTKADSSFVLFKRLRLNSLRLLLLMSSVTATFGNRGQIDYGAANGILNALALWARSKLKGRVVAVNWGPWDKRGMVTAGIREQFSAAGIEVVSPESGCFALEQEIERGQKDNVVVVVGNGPWARHRVLPSLKVETAADGPSRGKVWSEDGQFPIEKKQLGADS